VARMSEIKTILGDELYKQVAEKLGDKKIDIISDKYVPIERFKAVNDQKNEAEKAKQASVEDYESKILKLVEDNKKTQSKFEKQIEELSSKGLKVDEYEKQIKEIMDENQKLNTTFEEKINALSQENQQAKEQYEKELNDRTLNQAIERQLEGLNEKYKPFALQKIDKSKLIFDKEQNKVIGLGEQISTIKEELPEWFEVKVTGTTPPKGDVKPPLNDESDDALRKAFGLK
jgi:vacuolar-type H+-ATPase subunit I/STV1